MVIFFCILLSLDIKDHNALQVLKYIKTQSPSLKVILTMKNEDQLPRLGLDPELLSKQGVTERFVHPIEIKDLIEGIESYQDYGSIISKAPSKKGASDEEEVNEEDDKFTSVSIDEFLVTKAVQFDIYVKLNSGRYIKILMSGDTFSRERIEHYKNEKNVSHLYFLKSDRGRYVRMATYMAGKVASSSQFSSDIKLKLLKNATEKFIEDGYDKGIKPRVFDTGKTLCENIYEVVHNSDGLSSLLREMQEFNPELYTHAYLTTLFSCMLIKQFEWESKIINTTIGLAAMFHDIGMTRISPTLLEKRPYQMSKEELEEYTTHPEVGEELLRANRSVPAAVRQIVLQHHEWSNGSGFPYGIRGHRILTLSKIVAMCNDFVNLMTEQKIKPVEALRSMLGKEDTVVRYHSAILENFIQVFVEKPSK